MIIQTRESIVEELVPLTDECRGLNGCDNSKVAEWLDVGRGLSGVSELTVGEVRDRPTYRQIRSAYSIERDTVGIQLWTM